MRAKLSLVATAVVGVVVLLTAVPLFAHHSFAAEFDENKPITLKGTITKMEWVNPHAWLYIDVKEPDGKVTTWALEFAGPNALYRRGWRKDSAPVGAEVTVTGYLAKNGTNTANATNVTMPDGKRLFAGSSGTGAPYETERGRR